MQPMGSALPRRTFLRGLLGGAALAVAAGGLSGCAAGPPDPSRPLQFWHLFQGADGEQLLTMLDDVRARYPQLRVVDTCLAWGAPYYTKLAMASVGGRPPDLGIMHLSRLAGYAPGGLLQPYDPKLLGELGISAATSTEALWQRCQFDGATYAIPLDTHPFIAFYNLDIAEQAGLLAPDGSMAPIASREQFAQVGAKLAEASGDIGISFGFLNDTAQAWRLFWGFYGQTGGQFRFEDGRPAEWDTDKAVEVISFVASMMDGKTMSKSLDNSGGTSRFTGGKAGMILSGEWEMPSFAESVPRLGASPMPPVFGAPASYADSHAFVLPHREVNDPDRLRRTVQLATGLMQDGLVWAKGGHIPGYLPVTASAEYRALRPQSSYADAASSVVLDPPLWFAGAGSEFQKQMSFALIDGFLGNTTPQACSAAMLSSITAMLRTPNPARRTP